MKKNGFTLIELLAVIVILAIIALIATPIILGIINDAREKANERSVELYASAVRNAIAAYQLTGTNAPESFEDLDIEYDGTVVCETEELYEDGSFYIADCTVNGTEVDYTYGTQQLTQVYKPQYYWFEMYSMAGIGDSLPSSAKQSVAEIDTQGKQYYIGLDVEEGKVSAAYACFTRNGIEYCLKPSDFVTSTEIIKDAYSDVADTNNCSFGNNSSDCSSDDSLRATAYSYGDVGAHDGVVCCSVDSNGYFSCFGL